MIGNVIQSKFLELTDYPAAAAMSFILMGAILVGVFAVRARGRDRAADGVGRMSAVAVPARREAECRRERSGRSCAATC